MTIKNDITLKDIQGEFNKKYPFLKIEFYSSFHDGGDGPPLPKKLDVSKTIGEVRTLHSEGDLSIHPNQKISTLESNFAEKYGLNVQVFRRSGNLWLQTSTTDSWTLTEANRKGEHSVILFHDKYQS